MLPQEKYILCLLSEIKDSKIAFWGASLFLEKFLANTKTKNFNILGIIDNNPDKVGEQIAGYKVFNVDDILYDIDYIIVTIKNNNRDAYAAILSQLQKKNSEAKLLPNIFIRETQLISNKIYVVDSQNKRSQVSYIPGLTIKWCGYNSIVEIEGNPLPRFDDCEIQISSNCFVHIGSSKYAIKMSAILHDNNQLFIGKNYSSNGTNLWLTQEENKKVIIGDDCMFACGTIIRASDAHPIYNITKKKIINKSKYIHIGNHVWIGQNATILKNVQIPDNCIVGASSLVTNIFNQNNVIIAGSPAKIIKKNVNWERKAEDYIK